MSSGQKKTQMFVIAIIIWWAAYAVMLASQMIDIHRMDGQHITWAHALKYGFGGTWTWVPMTIVFYYLALHYPIGKEKPCRAILVNSLAIAGFIVAKAAYMYYTSDYFGWYEEVPPFLEILDTSLRNNLMMGWMVAGLVHGTVLYSKVKRRERRLSELSRSVVSAKLEALTAQVNPHFLFNALNSVAELMHVNPEIADKMVVAISAKLRDSLNRENKQTRSLREELDQLQNYLFIEKIRLGDRLNIEVDADEHTLELHMPIHTLQPIVENAIVHSIARSKTQGWLRVKAWKQANILCITVENPVSSEGARNDGNGIGMKIVSDRLALLYGEEAEFSSGEIDGNCYRVRIVIPIPEGLGRSEAHKNQALA